MADTRDMVARFRALDAALVNSGFPATSPWWLEAITAFYNGDWRTLLLRVGRRGGKSTTLCRLAVCEALWGGHKVPPGDIGTVVFVSASRDEASQRLRTIAAILDAVGVRYSRKADKIELEGPPVCFRVFTASVAGVSGPTAICVIADELAKWRDDSTGANPAAEVIGSLRPTVATMPNAPILLSSSAFSKVDYHYSLCEQGTTAAQLFCEAPTWTANPTITEASTHALEPDDRVWRREYLGEPQDSTSGAFDPEHIAAAFRELPGEYDSWPFVGYLDSAAGKGAGSDQFAWCVAGYIRPILPLHVERPEYRDGQLIGHFPVWDDNGQRIPNPEQPYQILSVWAIDSVAGAFGGQIRSGQLYDRIATQYRRCGIQEVWGDQFGSSLSTVELERRGLFYREIAWTNQRKVEAVSRLRQLFADRAIILPKHEKLKRELLSYTEKISAAGTITYSGRGNSHDDHAALLLGLAMVEEHRGIPGSTLRGSVGKTIVAGR